MTPAVRPGEVVAGQHRGHLSMKVPWWALPGVAAIVFTLASVSAAESSLNSGRVSLPREVQLSTGPPRGPPPGERRARNPDPVVDPGPPHPTG